MNYLSVHMTTNQPSGDDDDGKPQTAEEQHNDGEGTGHQK